MTALTLIKTQFEIEMEASLLGIKKSREAVQKAISGKREGDTLAGTRLVEDNLVALMTSIKNHSEAAKAKRGHNPKALPYIDKLGLEETAHLVIKVCINGLIGTKALTATAVDLGKKVHVESLSNDIRAYDAERYKSLVKRLQSLEKEGKVRNIASTIEWYAKETLPELEELTANEYARIGMYFIECLLESTDLAEVEVQWKGASSTKYLTPTEATLNFIESTALLSGIANPLYPLMVVPPKDWEDCYTGGYLTDNIKNVLMVKADRGVVEEIDSRFTEMPQVVQAINNAQKTAWKIDPWVFSLLQHIHNDGLKDFTPINLTSISEMAHYRQLIGMAERFLPFDEVYVPYQFDFRGRIYAVSALNPQGADWVKSLFRFAKGMPINTQEEYWSLAVHVANLAGVDKVSFTDRVKWAEDNLEVFWDYLEAPLENKGWLEADKPFQFLQAIRDFTGFHVHGWGYESSVPVALDGSCSGIQHFGMMTKDTGTCSQVNLCPNEKPDDIYQSVADRVIVNIEELLGADVIAMENRTDVIEHYLTINSCTKESLEELLTDKPFRQAFYFFTESWAWLKYGVSRKVCKRSVMTFAYGSGEYGYGEQLMEDTLIPMSLGKAKEYFNVSQIEQEIAIQKATKEAVLAGSEEIDVDGVTGTSKAFYASKVLAKHLSDAITATVTKPVEAMQYLQAIARETSSKKMPVKWVTPLGFLVVQDYRKLKGQRVDIRVLGVRQTSMIQERTREVDPKANANGVSPNFVHSMDATHLMTIVNGLANAGTLDVALVHDSFGTHAALAPDLFNIVRQTMEVIYETHDVLGDFTRYNKIPEGLLPVIKGNYELSTVNECDYAFA